MKNKRSLSAALMGLIVMIALAACSPNTPALTAAPTSAAPTAGTTIPTTGVTPASTAQTAGVAIKLNLNTATDQELLTIPNFGAQMLREFKEYRPYTSILQFEKELGKYISAADVAAYEQYVYVPIAINTADAATLMQIAGLDKTTADKLIAARPFASTDAFLTQLAQFVSAEQLAAAKNYITQ